MIKNVDRSSCNVDVIPVGFQWNLIFQQIFEKIFKYQISRKNISVGAELFRPDRRTDITKLIVSLRNFANAPKIGESEGHTGTENSKELIWKLSVHISHFRYEKTIIFLQVGNH